MKLLYAEDDETSAFIVKKCLESAGFEVVPAVDGEEAVHFCLKEQFDLILLDIKMPKLDGLAAAKVIRKDPAFTENSDTPIVAVTAYAMEDMKQKIENEGVVDALLIKPVDIREMHKTIVETIVSKKDLAIQKLKARVDELEKEVSYLKGQIGTE